MKACKPLLPLIFMLFCQTAFAQTVNSSITIRISGGNYDVSGVVSNDLVKSEVIEKIKARLGEKANFSRLIVQSNAKFFQADWQAELDAALLKIKNWKSGVFIFGNRKLTDKDYPPLPEEIAGARFELSDGRTISLNDYNDRTVVLFFMEFWAKPALDQARQLADFHPQIASANVEIISISVDNSEEEKANFRKAFERSNFPFVYGWTDRQTFLKFVKISRLNAVPQIFLIKNGRLRGVFAGGGKMTTEKLKETILKTLDEENL